MDIVLNLYLIRKGFRDGITTIAKVLINVFKITILAALIVGPTIIAIDPVAWGALNLDLGFTAQRLSQQMNTVLDVLLGLAIFGLFVDSVKRLIHHLTKKNATGFKVSID